MNNLNQHHWHTTVKSAKTLFLFSLVLFFAVPICAEERDQSAEAALAEMEKMFGAIPSTFQFYPKSAMAAGWALMKSTDFNENTALPMKLRELIGLAVASQIPCTYCIYYHTVAAKAQGATDEEIREAVHVSSFVLV